jgi:hypothetical protein
MFVQVLSVQRAGVRIQRQVQTGAGALLGSEDAALEQRADEIQPSGQQVGTDHPWVQAVYGN